MKCPPCPIKHRVLTKFEIHKTMWGLYIFQSIRNNSPNEVGLPSWIMNVPPSESQQSIVGIVESTTFHVAHHAHMNLYCVVASSLVDAHLHSQHVFVIILKALLHILGCVYLQTLFPVKEARPFFILHEVF